MALRSKTMKFKLGNIDQYVEVEIVYAMKEIIQSEEYFLVTEDILKEYGLTADKFILFLKRELPRDDNDYKASFELWTSNRGIYTKKSLKDIHNSELDKISKIITANEEINLFES